MAQNIGKVMFKDLLPENSSIIDFAYSVTNPLRKGEFFCINTDADSDSDEDRGLYKYATDEGKEYDGFNESPDEINKQAIALFDFVPENDNEVALSEGQVIWISYRHGQGWLVAEDPKTGENGLVPEEYVEIYSEGFDLQSEQSALSDSEVNDGHGEDVPKPFLPEILQNHDNDKESEYRSDGDWVDTDSEDLGENFEEALYQKEEDVYKNNISKERSLSQSNSNIKAVNDKFNNISLT